MQRRTVSALLIPCFLLACSDGKKFKGGTPQASLPKSAEQVPMKAPEPTPIPAPVPAPVPVPQPSTSVEFGETEVFHIGDANVSGTSSCAGEIKAYDLKGTTYFFEFEVAEDQTEVQLSIAKICGVDQQNMTTLSIIDAASKALQQAEIPVPTDKEADRSQVWNPYPKFELDKGTYSLVVTAKNVLGKPKGMQLPNSDEYDDFIIGHINLKANKPVRSSKVFAE